ncbi:MAG: pirin family protein [Actinomycetota bacterium]
MPAVTRNPLELDRLSTIPVDAIERPVRARSTAPAGYEGEGFPVRRAFAGVPVAELDPFVHMDQMGEVEYAPMEPKGTPWHPHRGFETVTYMMDGTFQHQDSNGGGGVITDGATQWMTAGAGILHIETPPEDLVVSGGLFHGVQLWVNLPSRDKMVAPRYQSLEGDMVKIVASEDGGSLVRIIAGDVGGHAGPGATHTPISVVHATLTPGSELRLPWDPSFNALVYTLAGFGTAGMSNVPLETGELLVFGSGDYLRLRANQQQESRTHALEVLVLGGRPIREPVVHYGPFVMNTKQQIMQAVEDYQSGKLGSIPANALQPYGSNS